MIADIFMYLSVAISIATLIYLLVKKANIVMSLMTIGIVLIIIAMIIGKKQFVKPSDVFYPLEAIVNVFKSQLNSAGFIILILGGYVAFINKINANDVLVNNITKRLAKIKWNWVLLPITFLMGNLLSLAIPNPPIIAMILMGSIFPILTKSGVSPLSAAGVIACTGIGIPTPLGPDTVAAANQIGMTPSDYTFKYHILVGLPALTIVGITHFLWQIYCDKKDYKKGIVHNFAQLNEKTITIEGGKFYKTIYTILPILPIILVLITWTINLSLPKIGVEGKYKDAFNISVEAITLTSFIFALICEWINTKWKKSHSIPIKNQDSPSGQKIEKACSSLKNWIKSPSIKTTIEKSDSFWSGMSSAFSIVVLMAAAGVFVQGLSDIGIIKALIQVVGGSTLPSFVLPLILILLVWAITIIAGSGFAVFLALAVATSPGELSILQELAQAANVNVLVLIIPVQATANMARSISLVGAPNIVIAKELNIQTSTLVKRTWLPLSIGVLMIFTFTMIFLSGLPIN